MNKRLRFDEAFKRVRAWLSSPHCKYASDAVSGQKDGVAIIDVTFRINLPSQYRMEGISSTGVRSKETVRFYFPENFPLEAPMPTLRENFSRKFPHVQPYRKDGRPVPCVYEGDLNELLHREGVQSVFEHTYTWLIRAAADALIDFEQGWEPMRRDALCEYELYADVNKLRSRIDHDTYRTLAFFRLNYLKFSHNATTMVRGWLADDETPIKEGTTVNLFQEEANRQGQDIVFGMSLALVVWPRICPSGTLFVADEYLPEKVRSTDDLMQLAESYSCKKQLETGINLLRRRLASYPFSGSYPLAVILAARRPCKLIGSNSRIELCPYVVNVTTNRLFTNNSEAHPAAFFYRMSRQLLHQVGGGSSAEARQVWALLGAGSLGSKLALHLARAGHAPSVIADNGCFRPHNMARHALAPVGNVVGQFKSEVLCRTLQELDQPATSFVEDLAKIFNDKTSARHLWNRNTSFAINATASSYVSDAIAADIGQDIPRIIETVLLANGCVGVMTVEGSVHNPSAADLTLESHVLVARRPELAEIIFPRDSHDIVEIGQGCGSATMHMTDSRLSLFSAGMSEYLLKLMVNGWPQNKGIILIGKLTEDDIGLQWSVHSVPPLEIMETRAGSWQVRISARAKHKMQCEIERWPQLETGGVLLGEINETSRTFHVVDTIEAPEDSCRSATEFVLKPEQILPRIKSYMMRCGNTLSFIGTWHSHLSSSEPSGQDYKAARSLTADSLNPMLFLVNAPDAICAFHSTLTGN